VRQQRLVADSEVVAQGTQRGEPLVPLLVALPVLQALGVRRLEVVRDQQVVDRLDPRVAPAVVVVELLRLPRVAGVGEAVGVAGRRRTPRRSPRGSGCGRGAGSRPSRRTS
jgi:hypothetical protein